MGLNARPGRLDSRDGAYVDDSLIYAAEVLARGSNSLGDGRSPEQSTLVAIGSDTLLLSLLEIR
jgi:hypothetical protein